MAMHIRLATAFASLLAFTGVLAEQTPIRVTEAWIREGPPVSTTFAGYMVLENTTRDPVVIVGASGSSFDRVEIHRTEITNGVARMSRQSRVEIPGGGMVAFEPGGYHLMLIKPSHVLAKGDPTVFNSFC